MITVCLITIKPGKIWDWSESASSADITSDPELAVKLQQLYGSVDNIDVWVGALAEDHLPGSSVGELTATILVDQFERIRDGDRFWYQNVLSGPQLAQIEATTLSDVLERNTGINGLRENVFFDASVAPTEIRRRTAARNRRSWTERTAAGGTRWRGRTARATGQ